MSTLRPKRLEKRDRSDASMRPKRLKNKTEANARPYSDTPNIFLPSEDGPRSGKCFQDRNVWETQIYPRHFCGLQVIRTKNKKMYCNCNHLPNGMQLQYIYIYYTNNFGGSNVAVDHERITHGHRIPRIHQVQHDESHAQTRRVLWQHVVCVFVFKGSIFKFSIFLGSKLGMSHPQCKGHPLLTLGLCTWEPKRQDCSVTCRVTCNDMLFIVVCSTLRGFFSQ
jgi:hypothetical protein